MSRGSLERSEPRDRLEPDTAPPGAAPGRGGRLGAYLRRLREGYGYTLRKVEERAHALGESIDNSQLSRFEKGKAVPSFDKLRALARIFNVPVQNFSDVLDLEEYEPFRPTGGAYEDLMRRGRELYEQGEHGRAYVTFEEAVQRAVDDTGRPGEESARRIADARWPMACALRGLGKLAMAEHEIKEILRHRENLPPATLMRTLLQLGFLYRELGDLYLASLLARECLELARSHDDRRVESTVHNTLGNIALDEERFADAAEHYREALDRLDEDEGGEMGTVYRTNLGGALVAVGRFRQGVRILRDAHATAVRRGYRRCAALALTRLAEAHLGADDAESARRYLGESDRIASAADAGYHDILFLNTFRRWEMARREGRDTREKIAFGRLRHLRALLQRRFPEVDAFDRHVERTRRFA